MRSAARMLSGEKNMFPACCLHCPCIASANSLCSSSDDCDCQGTEGSVVTISGSLRPNSLPSQPSNAVIVLPEPAACRADAGEVDQRDADGQHDALQHDRHTASH